MWYNVSEIDVMEPTNNTNVEREVTSTQQLLSMAMLAYIIIKLLIFLSAAAP